MAAPIEFEAGDTLDTLIHQFTDPFAFLRELIQNSLDAGSTRVDVTTEFRPPDRGKEGVVVLHVDDTGEGMNRHIIDTQLTRLFSSSKEGDLTKIGKFGIGFVSVFALDPEFVVVDTGRDGEYWRLIFKRDRSFERIVLDMPVDGTHIQVIKRGTAEDYEKIRRRGRETVVYWCKHCDVDIFYDGERINQAFDLKAPHALRHDVPGTEIVAAPAAVEHPFFGFYNRGLTLSEGNEALIQGVQFKIKSRYLEHTLTRDNVLRDENFHKAMNLLAEVVEGPLRQAMIQAAAEHGDDALLGMLPPRLPGMPRHLEDTPLLPTMHGPALSLAAVKTLAQRRGELFWDAAPTPVSEALAAQTIPVLKWEGRDAAPGRGGLLDALRGKAPLLRASETWGHPRLDATPDREWRSLLDDVERLLGRAGSPHRQVAAGRFVYDGSCIADRLYLVQDRPGALHRENGKGSGRRRWWIFGGSSGTLVVNLDHPLVRPHLDLCRHHRDLAAYLLAKCLTLDDGLDAVTETRLVEAALELTPSSGR